MTKIYAVMFEPFEVDGLEYVKEGDRSWTEQSPIKVFDTMEKAQIEANKWNTGQVVLYEEHEPDFIME
jgi:hypothetical protein